jgi:ABC-type methionine transport system ATPase subunit
VDLLAIALRDVVKRYRHRDGTQIAAIDGLTLEVPARVCLGLLGHLVPSGLGSHQRPDMKQAPCSP